VRQPWRVVLDTEARCAPESTVFAGGLGLMFAAEDAAQQPAGGLRIERVPRAARGLDLGAVLARLAVLEMNEVLVECGATLAAGFIEAGLVDELVIYVAPHLLGADAAPLAALSGICAATSLPQFEFRDQRMIRNDVRWVLAPRRA
jgi:diaminohydroxyphosphoribosylaminopyrimidine deaminase/5-amino-6-(5-phosphoribosylamino)uracil reductase